MKGLIVLSMQMMALSIQGKLTVHKIMSKKDSDGSGKKLSSKWRAPHISFVEFLIILGMN